MAIIIATLALILAFTALWLASTAMKKMDGMADTFVQRVRNDQKKAFEDINAKIALIENQNIDLSRELKKQTRLTEDLVSEEEEG